MSFSVLTCVILTFGRAIRVTDFRPATCTGSHILDTYESLGWPFAYPVGHEVAIPHKAICNSPSSLRSLILYMDSSPHQKHVLQLLLRNVRTFNGQSYSIEPLPEVFALISNTPTQYLFYQHFSVLVL